MKNEQEPIAIVELLTTYRKFKKFIPDILITLNFDSNNYGNNCKELWSFINNRFPKPITYKMFQTIEHTIPKKWVYYIQENPNQTNKCVLIAAIECLIQSFKRHDIYISQSNLYNNPMDCLLDKQTWLQQRDCIRTTRSTFFWRRSIFMVKKDLDLSYKEALRRWPTSNMARIENNSQLIVSRLKKFMKIKKRKRLNYVFNNYYPKLI
ncbi:hypothetical protein [Enterococcus faecalis]|uniref:hypothetical protein n=1 Tax=Enterococcus faecalis TaxID=1351 RepID=UPI001CEC1059|nr:hypothetical protein [Enterococcus faecalis]